MKELQFLATRELVVYNPFLKVSQQQHLKIPISESQLNSLERKGSLMMDPEKNDSPPPMFGPLRLSNSATMDLLQNDQPNSTAPSPPPPQEEPPSLLKRLEDSIKKR